MEIRILENGDAKMFREFRLRALQDSPESFGRSYQEEVNESLEYWEELIASSKVLMAFQEGEPLGMLFAFLRKEDQETAGFGGMWVQPESRKKGVASALVEEGIKWVRGKKLRGISLWNVEDNKVAGDLYLKFGFQPTEETRALESNAESVIRLFKLDLN